MLLAAAFLAGVARPLRAQTTPPASSAAGSAAAGAAVMRNGKMMALKEGQLVPMTADMPLANGAKVSPTGKLMMPGGEWMPLHDGDEVKNTGHVVPGPQPAQRRLTRFNKHVAAGH
jgi:hypothetical protein